MTGLLERLAQGEILIFDGAMGTLLQAQGLKPGECPESWCVTHPDVVRAITAAYVAAGSDLVETNSFGGTRSKLHEYDLEDKVIEINRAASALAKEAIGGNGYVAASVGPTGRIVVNEGGSAGPEELYEAFAEQVVALAKGGADAICIESQFSLVEAAQAIKAAKEQTSLPVICTYTFTAGTRGYRTMMGATPEQTAVASHAAGADIIGANCSPDIAGMIEITRELRAAAPTTPILIQPNAGLPDFDHGKTVFKELPEDMAAHVKELLAAGATLIGGCCGTTPAHISAIAAVVKQQRG